MKILEFEELLNIYGPHLARWPDNERGSAEKFLSESAEAKKLKKQADDLFSMLNVADVPEMEPGILKGIVKNITSKPQSSAEIISFPSVKNVSVVNKSTWYVLSSGLIAAAIFGFMVFSSTEQPFVVPQQQSAQIIPAPVEEKPDDYVFTILPSEDGSGKDVLVVRSEEITDENIDDALYSLYDEEEFEEEILSLL